MNAKELAQLKNEELESKLKELRAELMKTQTQIATGSAPKSPGQVKHIKKTIARILTQLKKNNQ
ncbi:50S ribosomal protein L29 [Candidatus Woesearchaeota archaeon]|jgi:large subunit ribosomal protein L29|nr:MAG: 50S ribosomal protein L29 [Candidatus Woesearchaeota archaeon]